MARVILLRAVLIVLALACYAHAFYLPGVAPIEYNAGDRVYLSVNQLTSVHTQLPMRYYTLPFCRPETIEDDRENLGELLLGDRIENSPYLLAAKQSESCKVLCPVTLTKDEANAFIEAVEQEYRVHWIVDGLPSATKKSMTDANGEPKSLYEAGHPVGETVLAAGKPTTLLNNHVDITILYHEEPVDYTGARVVGFEVRAHSVAHNLDYPKDGTPSTCPPQSGAAPLVLEKDKEGQKALFTYSVKWEQSEHKWASRWDSYLLMTDDQIHWFSIINSLMIVLFLTGMVAMIMMRTLHADVRRYREMAENAEEAQEETGWKLVHGDVFRAPSHPMLLAVSVGNGVQVFAMTVVTMIFAVLGFLSPANRGALMTAMVVLLVVMGIRSGYYSARIYKMFKGKNLTRNTLATAMLYPSIVFTIFFVLNTIIMGQKTYGAVPFLTLLEVLGLWLCISVPLAFLGAYFGWKKPVDEPPVRVNQIPRQIPEQVWYMKPIVSILMGGILPFGAIFIELFFILSSIWLHKFYYLFGFLFIVFVILILTCAEITIVMCYFQLCSEDYHWWWRAFLTSGASALYVFLYSVFYFFSRLQITKFVSAMLYMGYTAIMALEFFLLTGTIGFFACYYFVRQIYSSIKVD